MIRPVTHIRKPSGWVRFLTLLSVVHHPILVTTARVAPCQNVLRVLDAIVKQGDELPQDKMGRRDFPRIFHDTRGTSISNWKCGWHLMISVCCFLSCGSGCALGVQLAQHARAQR
jgi:hypothetical protein